MMEQQNNRFVRKRLIIIALVLGAVILIAGVGVVAANGADFDSDEGEIESIAPGALNVTDTEARETVLEANPGTSVTEVDLDTQSDGALVYDVSLDDGREIMISARTGEILGEEADDADDENGDDDD